MMGGRFRKFWAERKLGKQLLSLCEVPVGRPWNKEQRLLKELWVSERVRLFRLGALAQSYHGVERPVPSKLAPAGAGNPRRELLPLHLVEKG